MISQTAEYALRAVVCLAQHPEQPLTTRVLAERTHVPEGYLAKVMQTLVRAGLVASHRGIYGGFTLVPAPAKLTVLDVVNHVDPLPRIRHCPLGLEGHGQGLCPLHKQIDDATAHAEAGFARVSVAALLKQASRSTPLCDARRRNGPARSRAAK